MPGRTPPEAVEGFLQPLRTAIGCVARAHLAAKQRGGFRIGQQYTWTLNDAAGVPLKGRSGLHLHASMHWKIVETDEIGSGRFRVTTLGYMYSMHEDRTQLWALHWHPEGNSPVVEPHLHLPGAAAEVLGLPQKHHLPTDRCSFEKAIRWCIECGAEPLVDDWDKRLLECEAPHVLHRTWSDNLSLEVRKPTTTRRDGSE